MAPQTGTQCPYDREIKYSSEKSTQGEIELTPRFGTHILFVLVNYPAHGTFEMRKLVMMNGCQRQNDTADLSSRVERSCIRPAFSSMDRGF